jgi:hypothetical protein
MRRIEEMTMKNKKQKTARQLLGPVEHGPRLWK